MIEISDPYGLKPVAKIQVRCAERNNCLRFRYSKCSDIRYVTCVPGQDSPSYTVPSLQQMLYDMRPHKARSVCDLEKTEGGQRVWVRWYQRHIKEHA
jgi:hypothetical protein